MSNEDGVHRNSNLRICSKNEMNSQTLGRRKLKGGTVDGQIETMGSIVGWYLQRNHHSRVS